MTKQIIHIEIASIDEAAIILEVQKEAFSGQAKIYNNFDLPPLSQTLESIKREFSKKIFLKACVENQIIASVRFDMTKEAVTIHRLVVKPEYQNNGIGLDLLNKVEKLSPNTDTFKLFTGSRSVRNIHLYEKAGYKTIKTEFTDFGVEILHMEKNCAVIF